MKTRGTFATRKRCMSLTLTQLLFQTGVSNARSVHKSKSARGGGREGADEGKKTPHSPDPEGRDKGVLKEKNYAESKVGSTQRGVGKEKVFSQDPA